MASKRLTMAIKEKIISNVIRDVFPQRREALGTQYHTIAEMIYHDHVRDPEDAKMLSLLPESWFPKGKTVCAHINGQAYRGELPKSRPLPYRISGVRDHSDRYHYSGKHHVAAEFEAWKKAHDKCNSDEKELRRQTRAVLSGANTVKQLLELWPDGVKYLPADVEQPGTDVAVRCDKLNDLISYLSIK